MGFRALAKMLCEMDHWWSLRPKKRREQIMLIPQDHNRHPEMPKKPLSMYMLYYSERRESIQVLTFYGKVVKAISV